MSPQSPVSPRRLAPPRSAPVRTWTPNLQQAYRGTEAIAALFGLWLGGAVAVWWLTASAHWWRSTNRTEVALSELTGLVGVALLLGAVLLVARVPWLERTLGLDGLTVWHRRIAPWGAGLVTVHVVSAILGYAGLNRSGLLPQMWSFVTSWPDMLPAYAGFVLLIAAGVTSWRRARRRFRYETWWAVHLYSYLAIVLSLLHQIHAGAAFTGGTSFARFAELVWITAHVAVLGAVVLFRIGLPVILSLRHDLRIHSVIRQGRGAISVILSGRDLDRLRLAGGQFAQFRFARGDLWWQAHPYSISGLPWRDRMRITIAEGGDHAAAVATLRPGTRVWFEGPYGIFTADRLEAGNRVLLVAGGVGVTPVRTLLDDLPRSARPVVVYRTREEADVLFREELTDLVHSRGGQLHVLVGSRVEQPLDGQRLRRLVPDLARRDVYVCGPEPLVEAVRTAAAQAGVPSARVHVEEFAW